MYRAACLIACLILPLPTSAQTPQQSAPLPPLIDPSPDILRDSQQRRIADQLELDYRTPVYPRIETYPGGLGQLFEYEALRNGGIYRDPLVRDGERY